MAKIITDGDIGQGLVIQGDKLQAKVAQTPGNALQVTDEGLSVVVQASATDGFNGASYDDKKITLTRADGSAPVELDLADLVTVHVDVKLSGAELQGDVLHLELSDGSHFDVDLVKFVDAFPTAEETWNSIKALPTVKNDILDLIVADVEVQSLDGTTLGYLVRK